jgi:hypothetical protein
VTRVIFRCDPRRRRTDVQAVHMPVLGVTNARQTISLHDAYAGSRERRGFATGGRICKYISVYAGQSASHRIVMFVLTAGSDRAALTVEGDLYHRRSFPRSA